VSDLLVEDDLFNLEFLLWLAHDVCFFSCFVGMICFALDTRVLFMIAPFQFSEIAFSKNKKESNVIGLRD
jgi:hypothetical protein